MLNFSVKILIGSFLFQSCLSWAGNYSKEIDELTTRVMNSFDVPGVAIGVIKDNQVVHLKGYGIANIDLGNKVDADTVFKIASNSKAFTAAALAILVDQGKLKWDDKVVSYLPNFQMYDPWVTETFNIRDLLTHRSGLRIGAGDLMLWPEPTKFSRKNIIENLRYLKPVSSFRDKYAYDNLLYIVAGEVVAKISGMRWEDFVGNRIFKPLLMKHCFAGGIDTKKFPNVVAPHTIVGGKLLVNQPNLISNKTSLMAAAGGIKCSVKDLLKWLEVQLNNGQSRSGFELFSKTQRDMMWKPVTSLPLSAETAALDNSHYRGYALGWRVSDYHGYWKVSHTGTLSGSMSQIVMIPDENLAVVILTNQQSSAARNSLAKGILQLFINSPKTDWVKYYQQKIAENKGKTKTEPKPQHQLSLKKIKITANSELLLGRYLDPWFGEILITRDKDEIIFSSKKSPRLIGKVYFFKQNQWWVKWNDRSFDADAWLLFDINKSNKKVSLKMRAVSDSADWSFDFEDLFFQKVAGN